MKHLLKILLCVLAITLASVSVVSAAESTMNITWKGNYSDTNTELVVTFKSPAIYPQQVTAVMYGINIESPTMLDYLRVKEISSEVGEEKTFTIKLGNDLNAEGGKYKLNLRGNGHLSAESSETVTVAVLTPDAKAANLTAIRNATTTSSLASALENVKDALQMDIPADETACNTLMTEVLKVKANDYNSTFATMNEVYEAYAKAEIIVYLKSDEVTADGLMKRVEKNAVLFGFDKTNTDYVSNKDDIYKKVLSLKNTYSATGISTWQQLIDAVEETTGIEYINNSEIEKVSDAVAKYRTVIGISDTSYASYLTLSETGKDKVLRQVYASNFSTAQEIKKAFEDAVAAELNVGSGSSGGGTGGGGSSGGGGGITIGGGNSETVNPEVNSPAVKNDAFADVNESHWANTYIENLNSLGIISGYPDGTFKPENTVTREEFVKMIISAAGLYDTQAECEFSDVNKTDWSYAYIASANKAGVVSGISQELFGVGQPVTRQDVALIGARLLDYLKNTNKATLKSATTSFADNDEIGEYAMPGVSALVDMGIINGFDDNTFRPAEFLTRAQAAKIIYMIRAEI